MLKRPQRKRPLGIQVIAGAYLGFPLLGPLFMWLTYRDAPDSVLRVLASLTPGSLAVMASVVLVGVGIWQVRAWGWYLFLAHSAFILAHNVYVYRSTGAVSLALLLVANGALLAAAGSVIRSNVRAPYFNPKLRYWEQKPRVAVHLPAALGVGDQALSGETFDISESGAFVCCTHDGIEVGARLPVALAWPGGTLSCEAEVVWKSNGQRDTPTGVGIRFQSLRRTQRAALRGLVQQFAARRAPTEVPPPRSRAMPAVAGLALALAAILTAGYVARTLHTQPPAAPVSTGAPMRTHR